MDDRAVWSGRRRDGRVGPNVLGDEIGVRAEAVAGSFDLDDDGGVQKTIQKCGCNDGISEDLGPFANPRLEVRITAPLS